MPLHRRIPKRGFHNPFSKEYAVINLEALKVFSGGDVVTPETLRERGLAHSATRPIKILGDGELNAALTVRAHAFSRSAEEKIARAGGKIERIS
jgi:large subunit ribosomal protein L15